MFRSISIFLVVLWALTGCATSAGYQKLLTNWVGSDELSLVRKWGAPTRVCTFANRRFLVFESHRQDVQYQTPGYFESTGKGNKVSTVYLPGSPAMTLSYHCTTTFELSAGRVLGSTFAGNDCRARE